MPNDTNIVEKKCALCGLLDHLNEKNSLCGYCHAYTTNKREKTKETAIKNMLEKYFKIYSHDKVIDVNCNLKRPDIVIDMQAFVLVVEVDEFQHSKSGYSCECEQARMGLVHQAFGSIPLVMLRYNPDNYKVDNKIIRPSAAREKELLDLIKTLSNTEIINHAFLVCHLYYDEYKGIPEFYNVDYIDNIVTKVTL